MGVEFRTISGAGGTPLATTVVGPDAFGAPAAVGTSTSAARADHDHGLPAAPAVPAAATTVVGPDAYGAAAAVGTSTAYARADHDHGLPAAPSPTLSQVNGRLAANVSVAALTTTVVLTSASLATGTWLVSFSTEITNGGAAAGKADITTVLGTAVGTFYGPIMAEGELPAISGGPMGLAFTFVIVVTTAGTLQWNAYADVGCTVLQNGINNALPVTGYTAVKIG